MFRMLKGETISEVQKRFTHIINHLMSLDKTFDKEELNIKILECLDRAWQPKVTAISESKDLTSLSVAYLFGNLREHELEMNRLNVQESEDKNTRSIALKASKHKGKQDSSDDSDRENLRLLSRKFSKFLKRNRNKDNNKDRYGNKKSNDFISNNCSRRLSRVVFMRGLSSRAREPSFCSVREYLKRSEQRGALAAVCTPTIKSASGKHQR